MLERKRWIHKDMNIGEVIEKYPKAGEIFRKHFGEGCFNCIGSRMETIDFGALMHRTDPNVIVKELNAKLRTWKGAEK